MSLSRVQPAAVGNERSRKAKITTNETYSFTKAICYLLHDEWSWPTHAKSKPKVSVLVDGGNPGDKKELGLPGGNEERPDRFP